jgi:hypothetical protein
MGNRFRTSEIAEVLATAVTSTSVTHRPATLREMDNARRVVMGWSA